MLCFLFHFYSVRKGIKRQRYQRNERYKLQKVKRFYLLSLQKALLYALLKVQKQSTVFPKLSDEVLAKISLQKTQRYSIV